jgi:hypothetical protein
LTIFHTEEQKRAYYEPTISLYYLPTDTEDEKEYKKNRLLTIPQIYSSETHDGIVNKLYSSTSDSETDQIQTAVTFTNGLRYNLLDIDDARALAVSLKKYNPDMTYFRHLLTGNIDTRAILTFLNSLKIITDLYIVDGSCSGYDDAGDRRQELDAHVEEKYKRYAKGGKKRVRLPRASNKNLKRKFKKTKRIR